MIACSFAESNHVLDKPAGMSREECDALSVFVGNSADGKPVTISCWKLTREELGELNRTGRLWLWIHGHGMPPVSLETKHPFA